MDELNILILQDVTAKARLIEKALKKGKFNFDSKRVISKFEFEKALKSYHPDVIFADFHLSPKDALDAYQMAHNEVPQAPFIIISDISEETKEFEALQCGTTGYVLKDDLLQLPQVMEQALKKAREQSAQIELSRLRLSLEAIYKVAPTGLTILDSDLTIISASPAFSRLTALPVTDHNGRKLQDVIPELAAKSELFLKRVIRSGRPILGFEVSGRTPAFGLAEKDFLMNFYPVQNADFRIIGISIEDISSIKQAEAARFESEIRFRQIEGNMDAIVWILEADTNKLKYISPACEKVWGVSTASLYEDPFCFLEKVHPKDQEFVEKSTLALLRSDKPEQFELQYRILTEKGKEKWLHERGFSIKDKKGAIMSFGRLIRDISKTKLIEKELSINRTMLSETQSMVNLGSFEWYVVENKVIWSDQLYRILGYAPGDISASIGSYLRFVFPEDKRLVKEAIDKAIARKEGFELEHRIVLQNGITRVVALMVKVKWDSNDIVTKLVALVQDITDKKQVEEVVHRFGRILDSSLNELYIFREDTMHFIQASRSALNNLGYQLEELKQLTPMDIQIGVDERKMDEWILPLKSGKVEGIAFESVNRRKDGTFYPIETRLQYLRSETPPVFLAEVSDVSERRKAQQAKYEGQEMERKRIAMEIHDGIGQMLIAIKQRVMNLDFEKTDKEELVEKITEIDNILSMTIEETRRTSNNLAPIVLKQLGIEDAIEMLCVQTEKISDIKVHFDHKGPKIRADESILLAIYRILQEALNNIVKHSEASQAKVQFFQDKRNISLIIADDGKGFNMNQDVTRGSNGLSNMQERAGLVGGNFYIETREKSGTYIKVDVPI